MKKKTATILKKCGVPPHVKGYEYLGYALECVIEDRRLIHLITKELYPKIAEHFNTEPTRVERAIRTAIQLSADNLTPELVEEIFGNTVGIYQAPTNALFISAVAELLEYTPD